MRFSEIINEITRRDFLKGAGATAGLVMMPNTAQSAEYTTRSVGKWTISIRTSKFDQPEYYAWNEGFYYNGRRLTYSNGSGKSSSNFNQIKPNTLARYIVDNNKNIKGKITDGDTIDFTADISELTKAKTIEINFENYNRLYRETSTRETKIDLSGFKEVVDFFKNPTEILAREKQTQAEKDAKLRAQYEKDAKQKEIERLKNQEKEQKQEQQIKQFNTNLNSFAERTGKLFTDRFKFLIGSKMKNVQHIPDTKVQVQIKEDGTLVKFGIYPNQHNDQNFSFFGLSAADQQKAGKAIWELFKNPKLYIDLFSTVPPDVFQQANENGVMVMDIIFSGSNQIQAEIKIPKLQNTGMTSSYKFTI
jgi:hypothetical protein